MAFHQGAKSDQGQNDFELRTKKLQKYFSASKIFKLVIFVFVNISLANSKIQPKYLKVYSSSSEAIVLIDFLFCGGTLYKPGKTAVYSDRSAICRFHDRRAPVYTNTHLANKEKLSNERQLLQYSICLPNRNQ